MENAFLWILRICTFLILMAVIPLGLKFVYNMWEDWMSWSNNNCASNSHNGWSLPLTKGEFYGGVSFLVLVIMMKRTEFSKELFGISKKKQ